MRAFYTILLCLTTSIGFAQNQTDSFEVLSEKTYFEESGNHGAPCLIPQNFNPLIELVRNDRGDQQYICTVPLQFRKANGSLLNAEREIKYSLRFSVRNRRRLRNYREFYRSNGAGDNILVPIPRNVYLSFDGVSSDREEARIDREIDENSPDRSAVLESAEAACMAILQDISVSQFCGEVQ